MPKLTKAQQEFAAKISDAKYTRIKVANYREAQVALRASRSLGLRSEHCGVKVLVIRGTESPLVKMARQFLRRQVLQRPLRWKRDTEEKMLWVLRKFPELLPLAPVDVACVSKACGV